MVEESRLDRSPPNPFFLQLMEWILSRCYHVFEFNPYKVSTVVSTRLLFCPIKLAGSSRDDSKYVGTHPGAQRSWVGLEAVEISFVIDESADGENKSEYSGRREQSETIRIQFCSVRP